MRGLVVAKFVRKKGSGVCAKISRINSTNGTTRLVFLESHLCHVVLSNDEIHTPSGSLSRLSGTPGRLVTIDTWNGEGGGRRKLFHRIQHFHCRLLFAFLSIVLLLFPCWISQRV